MRFRRVPINTTPEVPEKGSIITGKKDAIFLRNRYQKELDNAHAAIVNTVHYLEDKISGLKALFNKAQSSKKNIEAHKNERADLYESLSNFLNKEIGFESEMWKNTLKKIKAKSITIKQKFKDADIDEIRYDTMQEFFKQYPEYASKSTFRRMLEDIEEKEAEIRRQTNFYNQAVSEYNYLLSLFEKDIQKAEDKFGAYEKILEEGSKKLRESRYVKSIFYRLATEKEKMKVSLDTLHHRVVQFRNTLNIIKNELSQYTGKKFVEMEY